MNREIAERINIVKSGNVPLGYKKSKIGVLPLEWKVDILGKYVDDMKSGLSRKLSDLDIGVPVIRSNNMVNSGVDFRDIKYWYLDDPQGVNTENYFLKNGDILVNFINSISQIGKTSIYKNIIGRDTIFTTNILKMTLKNGLDSRYFMYFSITEQYNSYINSITKPAVNQASFTTVEFKKMQLAIPSQKEQEKIAYILLTWDKAIDLKEKLLQEKQKQKKGLMERLLTGKVRLKGFNEEWKEVRLSKMFDRVTRKNSMGNSNVLTISAQQGLINQKNYFSKLVASDTLDNYYLLNNGEFAYNKSYSNGYPMGAIKRLNNYESGVVTTLYICFKLKDKFEECSDFLEQYFELGLMNKGLTQIAYEGGRAHGLLNVTSSDFFSLKTYIPSIEEQVEIAKILRIVNNEVSLLKQEIEAIKEQKKGLMQLLLTGIVRVNCN